MFFYFSRKRGGTDGTAPRVSFFGYVFTALGIKKILLLLRGPVAAHDHVIAIARYDIVARALFTAVKPINATVFKDVVLDANAVGCRNVNAAIPHTAEGVAIDLHVAMHACRI